MAAAFHREQAVKVEGAPYWMEVRYVPHTTSDGKTVDQDDASRKIRAMFGCDSATLPKTHFKRTGTDQDQGKRISVFFSREDDKIAAKSFFLKSERRWPGHERHPPLKLADETSRDLRSR